MRRILSYFAFCASLMAVLSTAAPAQSESQPLQILVDADYSIDFGAARAIELGIRTALHEAGSMLGGLPVEVVARNHRANAKRSHATMRSYLESGQAVVIFGGKHSPPYLRHREFINQNEILMLLPWSAAGPVTRAAPGDQNWIFRLSVDDSKAGGYLVGRAMKEGACNRTALLLLDTGWGRANEVTMRQAFRELQEQPAAILYFDSAIGTAGAEAIARQVETTGADCVILLANATEGAYLSNALDSLAPGIRMFSHWGILSSLYPDMVKPGVRARLGLRVLQTCGLQSEKQGNPVLVQALKTASKQQGHIASLAELPAPAGFVHAYDLTRLLIAAADQAAQTGAWAGSLEDKRRGLRDALEQLNAEVPGILGPYHRPFAPYSMADPDAHEALGRDDLCMTSFRQDGRLQHVSQ